MPTFLLSSYSASKNSPVADRLTKRQKLLLSKSKSSSFLTQWKPNEFTNITCVLVPRELVHNRTLKILWAVALRKPVISDEAFFVDNVKNGKFKLRSDKPTTLQLDQHVCRHFQVHDESGTGIFSGFTMRRFYATFGHHEEGKQPPKFKMPFQMLNEVCNQGLGVQLLDDYAPDHSEHPVHKHVSPRDYDSTAPDLIVVPTPHEHTPPYLIRRYEKHPIVRSAKFACITEKYIFDTIMGVQSSLNAWNSDVFYINIQKLIDSHGMNRESAVKEEPVRELSPSPKNNKEFTRSPKIGKKAKKTTEAEISEEQQNSAVFKSHFKPASVPQVEPPPTESQKSSKPESKGSNQVKTETTKGASKPPPVLAPQAAPLMSSENALLDLGRCTQKDRHKKKSTGPRSSFFIVPSHKPANYTTEIVTVGETMAKSPPTKRKRSTEQDGTAREPLKKRKALASPPMKESPSDLSSEINAKKLISDSLFEEVDDNSSGNDDENQSSSSGNSSDDLGLHISTPSQITRILNGRKIKITPLTEKPSRNPREEISDVFSPTPPSSHFSTLKNKIIENNLSQSSDDSSPTNTQEIVQAPKALKIQRKKTDKSNVMRKKLKKSGLKISDDQWRRVVLAIKEHFPAESHIQKLKVVMAKARQDASFLKELKHAQGYNGIMSVLAQAPINPNVASATRKVRV